MTQYNCALLCVTNVTKYIWGPMSKAGLPMKTSCHTSKF